MFPTKLIKLINFIVFQTGWIIIVYYHNFLSGLAGLGLTLVNYLLVKCSVKEMILCFFIAFLGVLNDFVMMKFGLLHFNNAWILPMPLWLIALWLLFVSTFSSSLAWLMRLNGLTIACLGALGGAVSYCAGASFNAFSYEITVMPSFLFHGLNWFLLFPLLFILYHRMVVIFITNKARGRYAT